MEHSSKRVVIIGGGFGGLYAAKRLARQQIDVTILDKRNFHLFQPLLYQVATGSLASGNIASPLRLILRKYQNVTVLQAEAENLDPTKRLVTTSAGQQLAYDYLIVATGVRHSYFGHADWEQNAPGLKTIEDAIEMRRRILLAFEAAECEPDPAIREAWLTFVIVGGGPTGVELAGAIAELAKGTLRGEYRTIDSQTAKILLIENGDRILQSYSPKSSGAALRALESMGVQVHLNTSASNISPLSVTLNLKDAAPAVVNARTTLWAAGVKATGFSNILAEHAGAILHRSGRVMVQPNLSLPGRPDIFVIGDLAYLAGSDGNPLPGVAPVAMQQAAYVSRIISQSSSDKPLPPFRYRNRGNLAVIGRNQAVMELGRFACSGFVAWIIWAIVHISYLIEFENKFSVILQWAWTYFTNGRGSRLITNYGEQAGVNSTLTAGHSLRVETTENSSPPSPLLPKEAEKLAPEKLVTAQK